jgi:single-strand DNA-binding protein
MNKVILLGRLTKEPELKYTSGNNTAICTFSLAVNRRMAKEGQQTADFINCQAWSKTAEFIAKYFQKGRQVSIVGRLQTRTWDDNEGKKHYITEVVVEEAYFADSKKSDDQEGSRLSDFDNGFIPQDDGDLPF